MAASPELYRAVLPAGKASAVPCCLSHWWQDGKRHHYVVHVFATAAAVIVAKIYIKYIWITGALALFGWPAGRASGL